MVSRRSSTDVFGSFIDQSFDWEIQDIDTNAWKKDTNCIVCNCKFGKIGLTRNPKFFCKFCFRGVCQKCSSRRMNHMKLQGLQRSCDNCFIDDTNPTETNLKRKKQKLKKVKTEFQQAKTSFKTNLAQKERELQVLQFELDQAKQQIQTLKQKLQSNQSQNSQALIQQLTEAKKQIQRLRSQLQEKKTQNTQQYMQKIQELKQKLKQVEENFLIEKKELTTSLKSLKDQLSNQQSTNQQLRDQIENDQTKQSQDSKQPVDLQQYENTIKALKEELIIAQSQILRLQSQDQKSHIETSNCKCFIM